eukprot:TRINITY_DN2410_c0_g1_i2.p1 TRINITY_DN2410_c0_g1~~TRINITY_DN2410_c0_g1_i2.p1  ORF type:complete len:61 (-),score=15.78 TRINITY_DN2410_c0_g1_i2:248-406(-)
MVDNVETLLKNDANVDYMDNDNKTALMISSSSDRCDTIRILLDHGAEKKNAA